MTSTADPAPRAALFRAALPFGLLLTGVGLFLSTRGAQYADLGGAFSPTFFPRIVLAGWIALAAIATVVELTATTARGGARLGAVAIVSIGLLLYVRLLPAFGFFLCSATFAAIVLLVTGQRRPLPLVLFSLALPAAIVALFNHVLVMPLPTSPFVWWL